MKRKLIPLLLVAIIAVGLQAGDFFLFKNRYEINYDIVITGDSSSTWSWTPETPMDSFTYLCSLETATLVDTGVATYTTGAQRVRVTPTSPVDSYPYIDTFLFAADSTTVVEVAWTSPLQVCRITPTAVDSTAWALNFIFAGDDTLGISFTLDSVASVAAICDSTVALIEAATNLTDTVTAEDSATYIKVISLFSEVTLTDKWIVAGSSSYAIVMDTTLPAMICDSMVAAIEAAAIVTDSVQALDSTTYYVVKGIIPQVYYGFGLITDSAQDTVTAYKPTIAMICDSMTTRFTALDFYTAHDSTTYVKIICDSTGVSFDTTNNGMDTASVAALIYAGKTSYSTDSGEVEICNTDGYNVLQGRMILRADQTDVATRSQADSYGIGLADSIVMQLRTENPWGTKKILAADTQTVATNHACTLTFNLVSTSDTTLWRTLNAYWWLSDSTSDTTMTAIRFLDVDLKLK